MSNVAIVLLRKRQKSLQMLMVRQKNRDPNCKKCNNDNCIDHLEYSNPAGKIEENETVKTAAEREFKQETLVDLPDLNMEKTKIYQDRDTRIIISFVDIDIPEMIVDSDEIYSTEWVDLDNIPKLRMREIFEKLYWLYEPIWKSIANKN